jgi:membrane protein implicated in regulation of membrane protease activity
MKSEPWISRVGDRAKWIGTTTAMGLVFFAGGFLLMLPVMHIAMPSFDLLALKFAAAFGGSAVVALVGLALMLLAAALRQRIFRRRQQKNDQIADRIMGDLRANADAPVPSSSYFRIRDNRYCTSLVLRSGN